MTEAEGLKQVLSLAVYGPLGVLAMLGILVSFKFYMDNRADREKHSAAMDALRKEHEAARKEWMTERANLVERYEVKAEKNVEKYHSLAEGMNRVLDSATRRYPRTGRDTRGQGQDDGQGG